MTKTYKTKKNIFLALSVLSTALPVIIYAARAWIMGSTSQKLTLGLLATMAIILTGINVVLKMHLRSSIWILLIGIYICLNNITSLLIIIAGCTVADEFIFTPLYKKYKNKYIINKEIDKRFTVNSDDKT